MFHAEALLLVHDHQAELLEHDVALEQPVRADQDVHLARARGGEDLGLLGARAEAADHFDGDRVAGHALAKRVEVLLREHGRRHEHRHLLAALHGLERRADGDLRLAEAHVAAD